MNDNTNDTEPTREHADFSEVLYCTNAPMWDSRSPDTIDLSQVPPAYANLAKAMVEHVKTRSK